MSNIRIIVIIKLDFKKFDYDQLPLSLSLKHKRPTHQRMKRGVFEERLHGDGIDFA